MPNIKQVIKYPNGNVLEATWVEGEGDAEVVVRRRAYDGILSACTYATSAVPKFASEGQYAVQARDATWATCYAIMADVQQGQRPMPTIEQVLTELPELEWPV